MRGSVARRFLRRILLHDNGMTTVSGGSYRPMVCGDTSYPGAWVLRGRLTGPAAGAPRAGAPMHRLVDGVLGQASGQKRRARSAVRESAGTGTPSNEAIGTMPRTAFVRNRLFPASACLRYRP